MEQHVLTLLIFLPIVAALGLMALPSQNPRAVRIAALTASLFNAVFALSLAASFALGQGGPQFEVNADWLTSLGIRYHLGVDGLSLVLVLITTLLTPLAILASFSLIKERVRGYYAWLLLLSAGMIGAVVSLDVFLFYTFFELMLIPAFFLIGLWGGPNRVKATVKFVVYTIVGSLLMFVAILFLAYQHYAQAGAWSFQIADLAHTTLTGRAMWLAFGAFVLAFAIKAGLWPFHTWAPDTYVEAPAPVTFLVSGVMGKIGAYGFLRFALPFFPVAAKVAQPYLMGLALIGLIYAAWVALAQTDIKRMLAYSSISHMAVIMLGIFALDPQAWTGAVFMFMAHALGTGGLFLMAGMLAQRKGTAIADFGGIAKPMPWFTAAFLILAMASIGLPGLNGFVGEFLILLGTYVSQNVIAVVATTSVVWGACYMLWMISRTYFGDFKAPAPAPKGTLPAFRDLSLAEGLVLVPIVLAIIATGFVPQPLLQRIDPSVQSSLGTIRRAAGMPVTTLEAVAPEAAGGTTR